MIIRDEQCADLAAISGIVTAAFGRPGEAVLVDRLRRGGDIVLSLVAIDGDKVVGHALLSRMTAPFQALGLGPVAVLPNRQRSGIGSRLIRAVIDRAGQLDWQAIFVLGDPNYYRRFGFDPTLAAGFSCRYAGPHLMVLPLGAALPAATGLIDYAPAFRALE